MKRILLVITLGLALALAACSAIAPQPTTTPPPGMSGQLWKWVSSGGDEQIAVDTPEAYSLVFLADGKLEILADCNTFSGVYRLNEPEIRIELDKPSAQPTQQVCEEGSRGAEFVDKLEQVESFSLSGRTLTLQLKGDGGALSFEWFTDTLTALTSTPWIWVGLSNDTQQAAIENPENFVIEFFSDSSVRVKADCKEATGQFKMSGAGEMQIQAYSDVEEECPSGPRGDQFLRFLNATIAFRMQGGQLALQMLDGKNYVILGALTP